VIDIGPQYERDDDFTRRMRWHQSWYRARVLRVAYGHGPSPSSRTSYGNMLNEHAASRGLNFLTPDIFQLARRRVAIGTGTVDEFRLLRNMLSSQPMAFNLFGELALNHDLATELVRALWGPHVKRVTDVRLEWAPQPSREYLDDQTAFDVFIEYEGGEGHAGFIGIEVKLTEPFSQRHYDKPAYRRWMTPDSPWRADSREAVADIRHNQLWRDHLLAWSMLKHPSRSYASGHLSVVFHPEDHRCRGVIDRYRTLLRSHATFSAFDLSQVISVWLPFASEWLQTFAERYLSLDTSDQQLNAT
jgi:hypothetical protein